MQTNKMYERINWYKKEYVHEQYSRIVEQFKDYDEITKKKMIEAIYKTYSDYNNIIEICTTRELKYLQRLLDGKNDIRELLSDRYEWERKNLRNKFLIQDDFDSVFIPDEIITNVKEAIKNVNWDITKKIDALNEVLVSYCKIQASALLSSVCAFASSVTNINENIIWNHMLSNKLFNYYVYIYFKDFENLGEDVPVAIYQDYYYLEDEIEEERKKQGLAGVIPIDMKFFKTLFYNDFDINNKIIDKFLTEIKRLPFFWSSTLDMVREFAVLNINREPLKKAIANVPSLGHCDLSNFFKLLDEAMDEMPSGALNGFTPNQAKELLREREKLKYNKAKRYVKQKDACLSKKDSKLFYKIYLGLLEFTNNKYKIKNNLKIYNTLGINPYELKEVIEKFWQNKETIVLEYCLLNPNKFNNEELDLASKFKNGFRDIVILARFEEDYTAVMSNDKTYMIKGLNCNIDNIFSYEDLPIIVETSLVPFKNVLVYDGLLMELRVKMGNEFDRMVEEQYSQSIKYYHM